MPHPTTATLKRRVYEWIEPVPHADDSRQRKFDFVDALLIALILANVAAVMLETVPGFADRHRRGLFVVEAVSIIAFTIEYLLRLWTCTEDRRFARPGGRLRFMLTLGALIDLVAIVPFYLQFFLARTDLRFILALRLLRMLRVLKIGRYSAAAGTLARVLRSRRDELSVMFMVTAVVLVVASGAMYYAEHTHQPEKFSSIPASMWWAVITLTTIGYGDVYPISTLGQIIGGVIAICGIGLVALPTAIIASGFAEEVAQKKKATEEPTRCPHCGKPLADAPTPTK